jgi:SAM-dependent methyltransferase
MPQAPLAYIVELYAKIQDMSRRFPDAWAFTYQALATVDGGQVLNVGCGPNFFDHGRPFKRPPSHYVGLDVSEATIRFLRDDLDPELVKARADFASAGTKIELVAADIFEWSKTCRGRFDYIVGRGVFGALYGDRLTELLPLMRSALKPGGQLVKTTWHGPHRSAQETADKLRYSYDTDAAPTPGDLVAAFRSAGFSVMLDQRYDCDPLTLGWHQIQNCVFKAP